MAKKAQKKPSRKSKTKDVAKKKKVTTKPKQSKAPKKKAAATKKKAKATAKKAAPKKKATAPAKTTAAPMKISTPKSASAGKSFSITQFAEMTYLTENGVRQWLQQGLLRGRQDAKGKWQIEASNLEIPNVKRLVR